MTINHLTVKQTVSHIRMNFPVLTCGYNSSVKEYRIAPKHGTKDAKEDAAYYTNDSDDACRTAQYMANHINGVK